MKFKAEEMAQACIIDVIVVTFSVKLMPRKYYRHGIAKEISIIHNRDDLSQVRGFHGQLK